MVCRSIAQLRILAAAFAILQAAAIRSCSLIPDAPARPRLILSNDRKASIIAALKNNEPAAVALYDSTVAQGAYLLTVAPVPVPPLNQTGSVRVVLQRIYTLGLLWQLTHNVTWGNRAVAELLAAASWPSFDVNFVVELNTGEMLHALGIGFDWTYDLLSPQQRENITNSIVYTGLQYVAQAYTNPPASWADAFVNTTSNWNLVINGGSSIGILSVACEDSVPEWVWTTLLNSTVSTLWQSVDGFAPDGGWMEGPNYAGYATRYFVPLAFSLQTATGSDYGLFEASGVSNVSAFALYSLAPNLEDFYWGDSHATPETRSQHLGLALQLQDAAYAYFFRQYAVNLFEPPQTQATTAMNYPVALLYYTPLGSWKDLAALPLIHSFHHQHAVYARASWTDRNTTFIGFKGSNISWAWAHNHLDAGSFVFQTHQQWFAQDLGNDNYAIPQYFSPDRFSLYRTGTRGHNTFTFDGNNQFCIVESKYSSNCELSPLEVLNVSAYRVAPDVAVTAFAVVNMTASYTYLNVTRAARGFVLLNDDVSTLVIVDEADASRSAVQMFEWRMHTVANISFNSSADVTLSTWNVSVPVFVTVDQHNSDCPGAFTASPLNLTAPQFPTPGVSVLTWTAAAQACTRLVTSIGTATPVLPALNALVDWAALGPFKSGS